MYYHFINQQGYYYPYRHNPYFSYYSQPDHWARQQPIRGQATWTEGGQVTECGIPWSDNLFMTAAVGENSPYKCGQTLKIRNISTPGQREVVVTIVDKVRGYPPNKINLHRRAFEALGANLNLGVINIEITPSPELEEEQWGKYLLELTETAYPKYVVRDYNFISKNQLSGDKVKETYEFILQSPTENIKVTANVIYNAKTNRVISFDLEEL